MQHLNTDPMRISENVFPCLFFNCTSSGCYSSKINILTMFEILREIMKQFIEPALIGCFHWLEMSRAVVRKADLMLECCGIQRCLLCSDRE